MGEAPRDIAIVILAAGMGTRMKSSRPKVLHELCGQPLLGYPLAVAQQLHPRRLLVVVGHGSEEVCERFAGAGEFVLQAERRGTGHAVLQAEPKLRHFEGDVLILYSDTPLLRAETVEQMRRVKSQTGANLVLLSALLPLPGRVVRDAEGRIERIVETTDATPAELEIQEGNTGVYLIDSNLLFEALGQLGDDNEQGEIYLTDVVGFAVDRRCAVEAVRLEDPEESFGVNTREELAAAAAVIRRRTADRLMAQGVTIVDPEHTYIDVDVQIGRDSLIEPGCVIQGQTVIGEGVHLKPHCMIESSRLDEGVVVGPSAHLRPGSHQMKGVRIGNFVEIKNSQLGPGVKADHLAYIGDADVGAGASFGCGAITANYDWNSKHRTRVGEGAQIGCNANLIAPVEVAAHSAVAAGSTVTRRVPEQALAVARAPQKNLEGWVARREGRTGKAAKAAGSGKPKTKKRARARPTSSKPRASKKKANRRKAGAKKGSAGRAERSRRRR